MKVNSNDKIKMMAFVHRDLLGAAAAAILGNVMSSRDVEQLLESKDLSKVMGEVTHGLAERIQDFLDKEMEGGAKYEETIIAFIYVYKQVLDEWAEKVKLSNGHKLEGSLKVGMGSLEELQGKFGIKIEESDMETISEDPVSKFGKSPSKLVN